MGEGLGPSEDVFGSLRGRITSQESSNQQGLGPTIDAGAFRPGPMWSRVLRPENLLLGLKMTRNLVGCAAGLIFWRYNQCDNGFASRHPAQVRDRPWASLVPCAFSAAVRQCAASNQISCGEKPPPRSQGFDPSMPLKCTAASLDSIAGDEIAKLRDFADDDVGCTNVDAD